MHCSPVLAVGVLLASGLSLSAAAVVPSPHHLDHASHHLQQTPHSGIKAPRATPEDANLVAPGRIIEHCNIPGVVALTFDDGPYKYTPLVLDTLKSYNVAGTFFINGDNQVGNIDDESTPWPGILRQMVSWGNQIGSHGYSHFDMNWLDTYGRQQELVKLEQALNKVIGKRPTFFRPPYAACNSECVADVEKMGYRVVNFDLDTKDYENNTPLTIMVAKARFDQQLDKADPRTDSFIVLSHDVQEQTANVLLEHMLQKIREKGFRAVTLGECLGDPKLNQYRPLPKSKQTLELEALSPAASDLIDHREDGSS